MRALLRIVGRWRATLMAAALRPGAAPRVSMVGVTDMPGRSRPAEGSLGSIRIFTGMRWTILVKLPVALSGGSSANSCPLAGAMLSTMPCTVAPEKVSTDSATGCPARTSASCVSSKFATT